MLTVGRAVTATSITLALPVVSCGLLFVGFLVADALDFRHAALGRPVLVRHHERLPTDAAYDA